MCHPNNDLKLIAKSDLNKKEDLYAQNFYLLKCLKKIVIFLFELIIRILNCSRYFKIPVLEISKQAIMYVNVNFMKPEEVLITSVTNSRQTGYVIIPIINV